MGNNFLIFLFASPKWGLLLKERICSWKSKFFPLRVDPIEMESKLKMIELLPFGYPLDLNGRFLEF